LDKSEALIGLIRSMEYRLWWHYAHLFNPQNFAGEKNNIYGDGGAGQEHVSLNMICAHRSVTVNIGAPEVTNDREHPLRDL
jgi:hypothetical protein